MLYLTYKIMWVMCMIKKQETMILSEYTGIYDLVVPKDNMLRKINELIDFSFVYDELLDKYCINGLMSIFWTQKVKLFYAALLANNSH